MLFGLTAIQGEYSLRQLQTAKNCHELRIGRERVLGFWDSAGHVFQVNHVTRNTFKFLVFFFLTWGFFDIQASSK